MQQESDICAEIRKKINLQISGFNQLIRENSGSQEKIVHELRKTLKRIRALLRLLKPALSEYDFHVIDHQFEVIADSMAEMRESTVMLSAYIGLLENVSEDVSERSKGIILRGLASSRDTAYQHIPVPFSQFMINHQFTMSRLKDQLNAVKISTYPFYLFNKAIENSYFRTIRLLNDALLSVETEAIHKWRKHLKTLLLQLKFSLDHKTENVQDLIQVLDNLTEILGRDHDLADLEKQVFLNYKALLPRDEYQQIMFQIDRQRMACQKQAFVIGKQVSHISVPQFDLVTAG